MSDITFRTSGPWGGGQGSNLTPNQVDFNFWNLYSAVTALQDHALTNENMIESFSVVGNQLFVTMMNNQVFGPYTLPTAQWNYRGAWTPDTLYKTMDVVTENGSLYLITNGPFTSAASFDAGANAGPGLNYYALLLGAPASAFPSGGTAGQVLAIGTSPSDLEWKNLTRIVAVFIDGFPEDNQTIFQYIVPEEMTFPAGLTGSEAYVATQPVSNQVYELFQNGSSIGSITFSDTPTPSIIFLFTAAVTFSPGDVLSLVAPSVVDAHMTNISISLVATLP